MRLTYSVTNQFTDPPAPWNSINASCAAQIEMSANQTWIMQPLRRVGEMIFVQFGIWVVIALTALKLLSEVSWLESLKFQKVP